VLDFSNDGPGIPEENLKRPDLSYLQPKPGVAWIGAIDTDLARLVDPLAYFTPVDEIDRLVQRAQNNTLVLLVSGFSYREVLLNFIWILEKRFKIFNYGIACMDQEMCVWLKEKGIEESRISQIIVEGILIVSLANQAKHRCLISWWKAGWNWHGAY